MRKKEKKIQAILLITGIFLILFTYFYYPYLQKNKSLVEKNVEEDFSVTSEDGDDSENATSFESLEYQGFYDLDKKFIVKSKKAHINKDEPDIVHMNNMHVILYLNDGRIVNIMSDQGKYNKSNYDCFFNNNVRATDGLTKIFSDNLDLLGNESSVKISMYDDERIKMKVFK